MADIEELKGKAAEVLSAVADEVEAAVEKAKVAGAPVAEAAAVKAKEVAASLEARGEDALASIEKHATKQKSHTGRKAFGWSLAALGAGGAAYLLWRRSRPVEDPWAEEYWVDLKDEDVADVEAAIEEAEAEAIEDAEVEAIVEALEEALAEADEDK